MARRLVGMMPLSLACAFTSVFLLPGKARSEEQAAASPIAVGSRVRLLAQTTASGWIEGTLLQVDDQSLLVQMEGRAPLIVPRKAINELAVSIGQRRQWRKGMVIGGVVAGSVGGILQAGVGTPGNSSYTGGLVITIVNGAVLGAVIGALQKDDVWRSVPLERLRVSLGATRSRGVQFSLSLAF